MDKLVIRTFLTGLFFTASLARLGFSADSETWEGWLTDSSCGQRGARDGHAACATKCVREQGAKYALYTPDTKIRLLSDQEAAAKIGAGKVRVKGHFDSTSNTIIVTSIERVTNSSTASPPESKPDDAPTLQTPRREEANGPSANAALTILLQQANDDVARFVKSGGRPRDPRAPYRAWAARLWEWQSTANGAEKRRAAGAALACWMYCYDTDRVLNLMAPLRPEERTAMGNALDTQALAIAKTARDYGPLSYWGTLDPEWKSLNRLLFFDGAMADVFKAAKRGATRAEWTEIYRKWASELWQYRESHPGAQKSSGSTAAALEYMFLAGDSAKADGLLTSLPEPRAAVQAVANNLLTNAKLTGDYAMVTRWAQEQERRASDAETRLGMQLLIGRIHQQTGDLPQARVVYEAVKNNPAVPHLSRGAEALLGILDAKSTKLAVGQPAPEFVAETIRGNVVSLGSMKGKITVLNMSATYCPICRAEIPILKELYARHAAEGLEIVSVLLDAEVDPVEQLVSANHLSWPQILVGVDFTKGILADYAVYGTPTYYVIDREGKIAAANVPVNRLPQIVAAALKG